MYREHRDLHVLTHSFPTRRSSDLDLASIGAIGRSAAQPDAVERRAVAQYMVASVKAGPAAKAMRPASRIEAQPGCKGRRRSAEYHDIGASCRVPIGRGIKQIGRAHV